MTKLTFSVVIPCFNCHSTLNQALSSIEAQIYPVNEVIVVDDCGSHSSAIKSKSIISKYKSLNIIFISMPNNCGPGEARNRGLELASGDLIAFLDADDEWHPCKTVVVSKLFQKDTELTLLSHSRPYIKNAKSPIAKTNNTSLLKLTLPRLMFSNIIPTSSVVIRRRSLKDFRFMGREHTEDYLLWLELLLSGHNLKHLNQCLAFTRHFPVYGQGYSANLRLHQEREIHTITYLCNKYSISFYIRYAWKAWSTIKYLSRLIKRRIYAKNH
ncbi:MAG: glycosyltransferase family 2 protein [Candidatus Sedimenticola endophacoides]